MLLSKTTTIALKSLIFLATHSGENRFVKTGEVAEAIQSPVAFSSKLMQKMARAGIISSKTGKNGGFYVSEKDGRVRLIKVIQLFEHKDIFKQCSFNLSYCSDKSPCPLHFFLKPMMEQMEKKLVELRICDLSQLVISGRSVLAHD